MSSKLSWIATIQSTRSDRIHLVKPKETSKETTVNKAKRLSNEFEKTEDSLYSTALEDINESTYFSAKKTQHHNMRSSKSTSSDDTVSSCSSSPKSATRQDASMSSCSSSLSLVTRQMEQKLNLGNHEVPKDVVNFDKENWDDVFQVSHYAMDIFNYLKEREVSIYLSICYDLRLVFFSFFYQL